MRRIFLLAIIICCQAALLTAQKNAPKWIEKQKKALVSVTTYGKDNVKLHAGTGFFVSETGDVLSAYSLFKGAEKATVTDTEGKVYPISTVLGADELYDVIKVKASVPKKVPFLSVAQDPVAVGTIAYLLPYSIGKAEVFSQGSIAEVSKLKDPFSYYKMTIPLEADRINAPLLTESGEVFGLAQADASGKKEHSYAVSAGYANSLKASSTDLFNAAYTSIGIRKAWPTDIEQALVSLYFMGNMQDAKTYLETLNDFVATFPKSADGYLNRSSHYAYQRADLADTPAEQLRLLDQALEDINTAAKYGDKKGDLPFNQAKLIYGVAVSDTTLSDPKWSIAAASEAIQQAIKAEDLPVYHQLEGDIYFYQKQYEPAFESYMKVNNSDMASAVSYYWAAKAKESIPGSNFGEIINLLDSAIAKCGNPTTKDAAPYILDRVDMRLKLMQYPEAIADYDLYYTVMNGEVAAPFYYYREQAKFRQGDLPGALKDIQEAIRLTPDDPNYLAEEASVYVRMQEYEKALTSVDNALTLAPDFAACYRLRGVCYVRLKKKAEACEALNKAKELGDPVADKLIKENCQ